MVEVFRVLLRRMQFYPDHGETLPATSVRVMKARGYGPFPPHGEPSVQLPDGSQVRQSGIVTTHTCRHRSSRAEGLSSRRRQFLASTEA